MIFNPGIHPKPWEQPSLPPWVTIFHYFLLYFALSPLFIIMPLYFVLFTPLFPSTLLYSSFSSLWSSLFHFIFSILVFCILHLSEYLSLFLAPSPYSAFFFSPLFPSFPLFFHLSHFLYCKLSFYYFNFTHCCMYVRTSLEQTLSNFENS